MRKIIFIGLLFLSGEVFAVDICVTVSTTVRQRIVEAFTKEYGYQPTINEQPNPETAGQFTQRKIREYIKGVVIRREVRDAVDAENVRQTEQSQGDIIIQ